MASISILILTWNEERNLADCLDSCSWSDDIVVFDSYSTDATAAIAVARGARFLQRRFDNYAAQRNAALTEVSYRHPWVLMVDADERTPPNLVDEMTRAVNAAVDTTVLFRIRRKDYFMGQWLRRSGGYPTWFGRLMRLGRVRVQREINEEYIADGDVRYLDAHLVHYPFNKGIAYWMERHNRYSTMEAQALTESAPATVPLKPLFSSDPVERRRVLKQLAYRLPCRPTLVFLYLYVVRLGFLDGQAGFVYCRMRAAYELMIDLKVTELQRQKRGAGIQ